MPRMIPLQPDADSPPSEKHVFAALAAALPPSWDVIHGRSFLLPATPQHPARNCEIDFIVLDPDRGFLVLEVKGGEVRRDGTLWYSIDRSGEPHEIKDPARQSADEMYALLTWLRRHPRFDGFRFGHGRGVVFPDSSVTGDLGPELPREIVVDGRDLGEVRDAIERLFVAQSVAGDPFTPARRQEFVSLLAPTARLVPSLALRIAGDEAAMLRLTAEQSFIVDSLAEMKRVAVKGCAGSGKTIVATERARREAAAGKRVLFLCFNRLLAQTLALRAEGFEVDSFHNRAKDLCRAAGIPFRPPAAGEQSEFWSAEAPALMVEALEKLPGERWDSVVVDEAQDFQECWWIAVEALLRNPETTPLWVFHDPNQDIFGGSAFTSLGLQPATLSRNCRNTARIASHAFGEIGEAPVLHASAPAGVEVEKIICANEEEMVDAVRRSLHRLIVEQQLDSGRVVILSPWRSDASRVLAAGRLGNFRIVDYPASRGDEVGFCNLQRFKGLEADAVILCEVRRESHACTPRHLYVAASRAKHILIVAEYAQALEPPR
jgi:hypothetical protein